MATVFGSLTGTSTVTSYVGIHGRRCRRRPLRHHGHRHRPAVARRRRGRAFRRHCPPAATAPALILVGSMMLATITEIRWHDPLVAVPAFLTLVLIPLTYSIANGLGFGVIAWAVLHLAPATAAAGLAALRPRRALPAPLRLSRRKLDKLTHQSTVMLSRDRECDWGRIIPPKKIPMAARLEVANTEGAAAFRLLKSYAGATRRNANATGVRHFPPKIPMAARLEVANTEGAAAFRLLKSCAEIYRAFRPGRFPALRHFHGLRVARSTMNDCTLRPLAQNKSSPFLLLPFLNS